MEKGKGKEKGKPEEHKERKGEKKTEKTRGRGRLDKGNQLHIEIKDVNRNKNMK